MPKSKINVKAKIDTYLSTSEYQKFMSLCAERKTTKSDFAREAIRFYLEQLDKGKENKTDSETARAIKSMTDRICGMLARQGTQTGTLFELAWQNHADSNQQERFIAATNLVKSNLRKRLEQDEQEISKRMKGVVEK